MVWFQNGKLMSVQQTSLESYSEHKKSGKADAQSLKVLSVIPVDSKFIKFSTIPNGITDREIQKATGISISSVTARRNKLVKDGLVRERGRRKCHVTGTNVLEWVRVE